MNTSRADEPRVVSVNLSKETGVIKTPVSSISINAQGVQGDAHAGDWHRQVSLLSSESIDRFSAQAGRSFQPGEFAENITTRGIDLAQVRLFDRFKLGSSVELEVTQIGKACHGGNCAIFQQVGRCVMPKEGIFTRVIQEGLLTPGDPITLQTRTLHCRIITLSDRASQGVYPDQSGPRLQERLNAFAQEKHWVLEAPITLIPDDPERLRAELISARDAGVNVIFTTGSTGIGPRDIAPDVVMQLADKTIPGIMEYIRVTYGAAKPNALLSRSVAASTGNILIYTLPGSVKAVDEYMTEILKTLEHALFMLNGLDTH